MPPIDIHDISGFDDDTWTPCTCEECLSPFPPTYSEDSATLCEDSQND